jgi:hypothetical protein
MFGEGCFDEKPQYYQGNKDTDNIHGQTLYQNAPLLQVIKFVYTKRNDLIYLKEYQ